MPRRVSHYCKCTLLRLYRESGLRDSPIIGTRARTILDRNGLQNIRIKPVAGELTDHYDPGGKVVRLSEGNYGRNSIAAASVTAYEVGHAIQDATGYCR